jgi:hypothetical protein
MRRHETAIGIVRATGGDALGDDPARGILAEVDHLGAAVDLLLSVRDGNRIELATRTVAAKDAGRVFPGNGRARLHLGPCDDGVPAPAIAALGDEVVDAAAPFRIARVPVLDRRIFDLGVV